MKFYFRGLLIIEYDAYTKALRIQTDAYQCCFIAEDFKLLAEFFLLAHEHKVGNIAEDQLNDVIVN